MSGHNPRRPMIQTNDVAANHAAVGDMHSSIATDDVEISVVTGEDIDSANVRKAISSEAFLNEKVEFMISTGAENESPYVELGLNGEMLIVERGVPTVGKRKHLQCLFTTVSTFRTEQYKDPRDGSEQTNIRKSIKPAYGVSLLRDSAEGMKWFQQMQAGYYI